MRKALMLAAASVMVLSACQEGERAHSSYSDDSGDVALIEPIPASEPPREANRLPQATVRASQGRTATPPSPKMNAAVPAPESSTLGIAPSRQLGSRFETSGAEARATTTLTEPGPEAESYSGGRRVRTLPSPTLAPLAPVAKIAYAFSYVMSAPKDRGAELMSRHEFACASAGPGLCQVVSGNADWTSRQPGGRLELRGQPEWINQFRATLAADARNAGGRLEQTVTEGVDVTRGIDEAATESQTTATIADRIKELQRRKGGTLAEQLDIERQLAALQRQVDSQQLELREMNDRVQSARLTIDYRQAGVMAADSANRPVAMALHNAYGLMMIVLAGLITVGSITLPIGALVGLAWWISRRRRKPTAVAA